MRTTLLYVIHMSKMIQIRNVPESLHRKLKARASMEGKSLSDYLLAEIRRIAERPTLTEVLARLGKRTQVNPGMHPADAVRIERDSR
jgi:plasmid stability protein